MSPGSVGETWFDPIEVGIRDRIRGLIEALVEEELDQALGRPRYQRPTRTGFVVIEGEYFSMWQSAIWNGQQAAFRFYATVLLVLVAVLQPDQDL